MFYFSVWQNQQVFLRDSLLSNGQNPRFETRSSFQGRIQDFFFRRGCTRLLLYFNTNKPHSFFFRRIPVVLENRRSSWGGGGGGGAPPRTPCTLPLDPPLSFDLPIPSRSLLPVGAWLPGFFRYVSWQQFQSSNYSRTFHKRPPNRTTGHRGHGAHAPCPHLFQEEVLAHLNYGRYCKQYNFQVTPWVSPIFF